MILHRIESLASSLIIFYDDYHWLFYKRKKWSKLAVPQKNQFVRHFVLRETVWGVICKVHSKKLAGSVVSWRRAPQTVLHGRECPKLNGSVRSNRKSFEKTGPPFEVDHFSWSDRLEFCLNGSRPTIQEYFESFSGKLSVVTLLLLLF